MIQYNQIMEVNTMSERPKMTIEYIKKCREEVNKFEALVEKRKAIASQIEARNGWYFSICGFKASDISYSFIDPRIRRGMSQK